MATELKLEQVAVHVDDIDELLDLFGGLGAEFPRRGVATVAGVEFEARGTRDGFVLAAGTSEPAGLRAVGFRTQDIDAVAAAFAERGIEPKVTIDRNGYREQQFELGGVVYSFAQYEGENRMEAASDAGIVRLTSR